MGDAHECERGQRGDRRRHAAGEAALGEVPAPQRARSARASRPGDRTGGGGVYRVASRVSAEMLARIGPVKPFLAKFLIAHSGGMRPRRRWTAHAQARARAAKQAPHRRRARPREGDAQERERSQRGDRRRHAAGEAVLVEVPAPQRARSARANRPGDRTGGGAAYSPTSLVSAVMLARIGPVKPFLPKDLIAGSGGVRPRLLPWAAQPLRSRSARRRRIGGEPGRAKGTHRYVSAVSAEIVGGTLPEKRFSLRRLRRSVPVQRA